MHIFKGKTYSKEEWYTWINTPDKLPELYLIDPENITAKHIPNNPITSVKELIDKYGSNFVLMDNQSTRKVLWDNPNNEKALSQWVIKQNRLKFYEEVL